MTEFSLAQSIAASGRVPEAAEAFERASDSFKTAGELTHSMRTREVGAQALARAGDPLRAARLLEGGAALFQDQPASSEQLGLMFQTGHNYCLGGDLASAIRWEEQALAVAQRLQDTVKQSQLVSNLAEFCLQAEDYRRAVSYLSQRLREVQASGDRTTYASELLKLAAAYTESGASDRALATLDQIEHELSSCSGINPDQIAYCGWVRGQALLDLKRYEEAKPLFDSAEAHFRTADQLDLIHRQRARCEREAGSPLLIDCSHRVLYMAVTGSSTGISHQNPQPAVLISDPKYLTSDLSPDERDRWGKLYDELDQDLYRTKWLDGGSDSRPGAFTVPLKIEYVDDVGAFEFKWAALKQMRETAKRRDDIQRQWEAIRGRFSPSAGCVSVEDLGYLRVLTKVARECAEIRDAEQFLPVALHLADLLESRSNDPVLAARFGCSERT